MKTARYFVFFGLAFLWACTKNEVFELKDTGTVGSAAHHLLSSEKYKSLRVEISYMPGYAPAPEVVEQLRIFLNTWLNKPGGITIEQKQVPASGESLLTLQDISELEKSARTAYTHDTEIGLHILIVDAEYNSERLLGLAYRSTSFCIFGKTVWRHSEGGGQVSRPQLFTNLILHETGHLLGLVNRGSPMVTDHRDVLNGNHCTDASCLMYYAIETNGTIRQSVPVPDDCCRADLLANGGKTGRLQTQTSGF